MEQKLREMESHIEMMSSTIPAAHPRSNGTSTFSEKRDQDHQNESEDLEPIPDSLDKVSIQHAIQVSVLGYAGCTADSAFIQRMRQKLGDWAGEDLGIKLQPRRGPLPRYFDPDYALADQAQLPPKRDALKLVDVTLDTHSLLSIIHRPTFDHQLNLLYSLDAKDYGMEAYRFLSVLYAVLALGCLFKEPN
jgi:hypothetical protein